MNELELLNQNTTEQKIINFYGLFDIQLKFNKKIESFAVDLYYFEILNNAKIKKIDNLITELQLDLKVEKIKTSIDNLSGCIIFELSKRERKTLYYSELKHNTNGRLCATIGKNLFDEAVTIDIAKAPHILAAGSTGSGKSCLINDIILSLVQNYSPSYVKLAMIDIKQVEFVEYEGLPHLATPIITDTNKAIDILNKFIIIMNFRYKLLSQKHYKNIQDYNKQEADKMSYYVIIVDELADLFARSPEIEGLLCRLAQLGRASGIHLICATQRPDCKTISSKLKINIPTRLALAVTSIYDSRIILDMTGAEKLTGCGDFILKTSNGILERGQGAFIEDIQKELEKVVKE